MEYWEIGIWKDNESLMKKLRNLQASGVKTWLMNKTLAT